MTPVTNRYLRDALAHIWSEYADDAARRGERSESVTAARAKAEHFQRSGVCICGHPVAEHFDAENRSIECERLVRR